MKVNYLLETAKREERMYKIKIINTITCEIFWEYGFTNHIMKRLYFFFNETDYNFYHMYEIIEIIKLEKNIKTFIKCLTKTIKVV